MVYLRCAYVDWANKLKRHETIGKYENDENKSF
jgi:hypothetical protein